MFGIRASKQNVWDLHNTVTVLFAARFDQNLLEGAFVLRERSCFVPAQQGDLHSVGDHSPDMFFN